MFCLLAWGILGFPRPWLLGSKEAGGGGNYLLLHLTGELASWPRVRAGLG